MLHAARRASGSKPVVGSSRKIELGVADEREREVQAARLAAGQPCGRGPPRSPARPTTLDDLLDVARARVERGPVRDGLADGQVAVHPAALQDDPGALPQRARPPRRIVPEDGDDRRPCGCGSPRGSRRSSSCPRRWGRGGRTPRRGRRRSRSRGRRRRRRRTCAGRGRGWRGLGHATETMTRAPVSVSSRRVRCACIDIGSNTTRLLVAEPARDGRLREVHTERAFTRLGSRLGPGGAIPPRRRRASARRSSPSRSPPRARRGRRVDPRRGDGRDPGRRRTATSSDAPRSTSWRGDGGGAQRRGGGAPRLPRRHADRSRDCRRRARRRRRRRRRLDRARGGTRAEGVAWCDLAAGRLGAAGRRAPARRPADAGGARRGPRARRRRVRARCARRGPSRPTRSAAARPRCGACSAPVLDRGGARARARACSPAAPARASPAASRCTPERVRLLPAGISCCSSGARGALGTPLRTCGGGLREGVVLRPGSGHARAADEADGEGTGHRRPARRDAVRPGGRAHRARPRRGALRARRRRPRHRRHRARARHARRDAPAARRPGDLRARASRRATLRPVLRDVKAPRGRARRAARPRRPARGARRARARRWASAEPAGLEVVRRDPARRARRRATRQLAAALAQARRATCAAACARSPTPPPSGRRHEGRERQGPRPRRRRSPTTSSASSRVARSTSSSLHARALADPRDVRALHDMRIAAKRLRYILEVDERLFGPYADDGDQAGQGAAGAARRDPRLRRELPRVAALVDAPRDDDVADALRARRRTPRTSTRRWRARPARRGVARAGGARHLPAGAPRRCCSRASCALGASSGARGSARAWSSRSPSAPAPDATCHRRRPSPTPSPRRGDASSP